MKKILSFFCLTAALCTQAESSEFGARFSQMSAPQGQDVLVTFSVSRIKNIRDWRSSWLTDGCTSMTPGGTPQEISENFPIKKAKKDVVFFDQAVTSDGTPCYVAMRLFAPGNDTNLPSAIFGATLNSPK